MNKGYEQFFKKAKEAADNKTASKPSPQRKSIQNLRKKKTRKPFPMGALIFSIFGFAAALQGYQNHEKLTALFSDIEISLFPTAQASNAQTTSTEKQEVKEPPKSITAEPTGEELNHLIKLVERKKELDAREEELNRMESELSQQKEDLNKKITELEKMRSSISNILEEKVKADDQKIETLVQFYSNMKPPQAAKIFETIDEDLAVQILGRMKKKSAADILNLMKPEKAQMFTEKYAGYKRTPASSRRPDERPQDNEIENEGDLNTTAKP